MKSKFTLFTLSLAAVALVSLSASAETQSLSCDSTAGNGAPRTCLLPQGHTITRILRVDSLPLFPGSEVVIPCVRVKDSFNREIFANYQLTADRKGVTVRGGCSAQILVDAELPFYYTQQTYQAPRGDYIEYPIGPNADEVTILNQNGRCALGSTLAWDLRRQVVAVNGDCIATLRIRHRR